MDQQGDRPAGAALLRAAEPCRAGHVQMGPFEILGELGAERRRGAGASFASADIGQIREITLKLVAPA